MNRPDDRQFVTAGRYTVNLRTLAMARLDEDAETGEASLLLTFTTSKRARVRGPEVGPLREFFERNAVLAESAPRVGFVDSGPGGVDPASPH